LFLYAFFSINFRGVALYSWIPNIVGLLLGLSFLTISSKRKFKFNYPLLVLLILVLWNFTTVFFNPDVARYCITSLLIFILAFIVYNICSKYPIAVDYIKLAFMISFFIQIWVSNTFIQYTDWGTIARHNGSMGNANLYAVFLNISFLFLLQKIGKPNNLIKYLFLFSIIGLAVFEIINTGSRKGLFLMILTIGFYFSSSFLKIKSINKIIYLIISILFLSQAAIYLIDSKYFYRFIAGFYYNEVAFTDFHRYALAQDGLRLFFERPIFGWGANGFEYFNNVDKTYSHINFLELLVNYGVIGLILFYSMYIWFGKKLYYLNNKEKHLILSDKHIFIFFLLVTLILDVAMVRIFERIYWLIISMYLGKLFFKEQEEYG